MVEAELITVVAYRINEIDRRELQEYKSISDILNIPVVNIQVPLADIYEAT